MYLMPAPFEGSPFDWISDMVIDPKPDFIVELSIEKIGARAIYTIDIGLDIHDCNCSRVAICSGVKHISGFAISSVLISSSSR